MIRRSLLIALLMTLFCAPLVGLGLSPVRAAGTTYYVSSSEGDDDNAGTSEAAPFATGAKVNSLDLAPGDHVLFKCGDTWRGEPLVIDDAGTPGSPITFGAYPAGCTDKPILSGAQPIAGWTA